MRGYAVKVYKGSGRANGHRWRGITAAAELTCGGNSRKFPSVQASESRVEVLGSFLVSRRSYCGAGQGLGGGGVAGLRWCREVCAAEQSGGVDVGLGAALEWQEGHWLVRKSQIKACGDSGRVCALEAAAVIAAEQITQEADRANRTA